MDNCIEGQEHQLMIIEKLLSKQCHASNRQNKCRSQNQSQSRGESQTKMVILENIGDIYYDRLLGDRQDNLHRSVHAYRTSMHLLRSSFPSSSEMATAQRARLHIKLARSLYYVHADDTIELPTVLTYVNTGLALYVRHGVTDAHHAFTFVTGWIVRGLLYELLYRALQVTRHQHQRDDIRKSFYLDEWHRSLEFVLSWCQLNEEKEKRKQKEKETKQHTKQTSASSISSVLSSPLFPLSPPCSPCRSPSPLDIDLLPPDDDICSIIDANDEDHHHHHHQHNSNTNQTHSHSHSHSHSQNRSHSWTPPLSPPTPPPLPPSSHHHHHHNNISNKSDASLLKDKMLIKDILRRVNVHGIGISKVKRLYATTSLIRAYLCMAPAQHKQVQKALALFRSMEDCIDALDIVHNQVVYLLRINSNIHVAYAKWLQIEQLRRDIKSLYEVLRSKSKSTKYSIPISDNINHSTDDDDDVDDDDNEKNEDVETLKSRNSNEQQQQSCIIC